MMIIDIETQLLKQMSHLANSAFQELQSADTVLRMVTEHHDWGCKERDHINEMIRKSRDDMKKLRVSGAALHGAVKAAADEFEASEHSIINIFGALEGLLGSQLSATNTVNKSVQIAQALRDISKNDNQFDFASIVSAMNKAIQSINIGYYPIIAKSMEE